MKKLRFDSPMEIDEKLHFDSDGWKEKKKGYVLIVSNNVNKINQRGNIEIFCKKRKATH